MRGTILKARTAAGNVFWHVPTSGEVVTKAAAAAAEYKLSINTALRLATITLAPWHPVPVQAVGAVDARAQGDARHPRRASVDERERG